MRTASMVLGIVGGVIAIILALILVLFGILFGYAQNWVTENEWSGSVVIDGEVQIDGESMFIGGEYGSVTINGQEVKVQNGKVSIDGDEVYIGDGDKYSVSINDDGVFIDGEMLPYEAREFALFGINMARGVVWIIAGLVVVGGVLGIVGGALVKRNNVLGGIFMLVAAFLGSPVVIPFIVLLIGGILALINEKPPVRAPQPPPVA